MSKSTSPPAARLVSSAARRRQTLGLLDMIAACLLFSLMNAGVYASQRLDPGLPAVMASFIRILCNLAILIVPAFAGRRIRTLLGDGRPSLWLRGLFGASALMLSFSSIARIGPGESTFLTSSSGVFVALLSPFLLAQKNSLAVWLAIVGAFSGVGLLFDFRQSGNLLGQATALGAGLLSALAYLMLARAGRSNPATTVIFYFCLAALILHAAYFAVFGFRWPASPQSWGLLIVVGLLGSGAQHYLTRAYQSAPAALVSSVGYLTPVLSLTWGAIFFAQIPGSTALIGAVLILLFGVLLPFLR